MADSTGNGLQGAVVAVSRSAGHTMTKPSQPSITLRAGYGIEGDVHAGATVKHQSRVRTDTTKPNLRQVHLIPAELHDELSVDGFELEPGQMGENITTRGVALLELPTGTRLHLGPEAVVEVTGLRNPCHQLDGLQAGLKNRLLGRDSDGHLVRKAGIMSVVLTGGVVKPGDTLRVELPAEPHRPLAKV